MKKTILAIAIAFLSITIFGQAKKPTLMVVPSDNWCKTNGYMLKFDNQGTSIELPDYKKAIQGSSDLTLVTAKISELMANRGFPCKLLEQELKKLSEESAEDAMLTSKSGAGTSESPIDKLNKTARADIIIQVTWSVNQTGPKKSVTYVLQGIDLIQANKLLLLQEPELHHSQLNYQFCCKKQYWPTWITITTSFRHILMTCLPTVVK